MIKNIAYRNLYLKIAQFMRGKMGLYPFTMDLMQYWFAEKKELIN